METALETDTTNLSLMLLVEKNAKSIGFVQIGMLPPPPGFQGNVNSSNSIENEPVLWKGVPVNLPDPPGALDVPYIANLCVLPSCRRSGLGKKLVDVCIKWLAKRNIQDDKSNNLQNVFISVDADNLGAKRFYLGNGFNWIEPPTTDLAVGAVAKREYYYRPISSSRRWWNDMMAVLALNSVAWHPRHAGQVLTRNKVLQTRNANLQLATIPFFHHSNSLFGYLNVRIHAIL
jgi:ribosomal protein S18 acetylase RimI-like enzyme